VVLVVVSGAIVVVVVGIVVGTVTSRVGWGVVGVVTISGCVGGSGFWRVTALLLAHPATSTAPATTLSSSRARRTSTVGRCRASVTIELLTSCSDRVERLTGATAFFATGRARSHRGRVRSGRGPVRRAAQAVTAWASSRDTGSAADAVRYCRQSWK
jgi:hypothetical protein